MMTRTARPRTPDRQRRRASVVLLTIACVALASCGDNGLATEPQLHELARAEALWHQVTGGKTSYTMEQSRSCECQHAGQLFRLTVENDQVTSVVEIATGIALPASERDQFLSVSQLFARIHDTLLKHGAKVTATYHTGSGYPTTVYLDPNPTAVDDEVTFNTANVATPLN